MKKVALLMVVILSSMWLIGAVQADDHHTVRLGGVITSVGDHGITLLTRRGEVRIAVTQRTRIERNGHRVRLGDLQVRDRAVVLARVFRDRQEHRFVALAIAARGR